MTNRMLSPIRDMLTLREAMDRLFDESCVRPFDGALAGTGGFGIAVDVQADKDDRLVHANVPGLKQIAGRTSGRAS